jgi:hypothetical protein
VTWKRVASFTIPATPSYTMTRVYVSGLGATDVCNAQNHAVFVQASLGYAYVIRLGLGDSQDIVVKCYGPR